MPQSLRYGVDSTIEFNLPKEVLLADCSSVSAEPLDDPAAAVAVALAQPLNFPPLARATVSGDRIAIVVEPGIPQTPALVAGIVHTLLESGGDPSDISIVTASQECESNSQYETSLLDDDIRSQIHLVQHEAGDTSTLAYLATSKSGKPIYVNRAIADADIVLPVGAFRLEPDCRQGSIHASLFRFFGDEESAQRVSRTSWSQDPTQRQQQRDEADEAAWLLGIQFTIQVIPGRGDRVLEVVAGDVNAVADYGQRRCESAWRFDVPKRASLVVATIDGGQQQQTWENFSRALEVASKAVTEDGTIVICSDICRGPRPALQSAVNHSDRSARPDEPSASSLDDPIPVSGLKLPKTRAHIYLLSQLDGDTVEELGFAHVAAAEEIKRLSTQHDSCILVSSAQNAVVVAEEK